MQGCRTLRSNTKNLSQIPHTNLKGFDDRGVCTYAPRPWNELPDKLKASDNVQNFKTQLNIAISKGVLYKVFLNIIGGKGAISNIIYHYYSHYYHQRS